MVEAILSSLLKRLVGELVRPIGRDLSNGVKKSEIESLRNELEVLSHSLKAKEEGAVTFWVKEMREVAELVEDVFDEYVVAASRRGFDNHLVRADILIGTLSSSGNLASNIRNVRALLLEIRERGEDYVWGGTSRAAERRMPPRTLSPSSDEFAVGVGALVDGLAQKHLVGGEPRRSTVALLGAGGIGKTTLAKKVYDDVAVREHFDCRAWVAVHRCHNMQELLKLMAKQICTAGHQNAGEIDAKTDAELISTIRQSLRSIRYLLVFDGVWKEEFWHAMRVVLPDDDKGSRIIVTTRSNAVAASCQEASSDHVHRVEPLSEAASRDLFRRIAFRRDAKWRCPPELAKLSLEITRMCEGLPLAIVAIAGLLSTKKKASKEWEKLLENFGLEMESSARLAGLSKILALCFLDLPQQLKPCFLYFSIFPRESLIPNDKLFKLWIAEDFVQEKAGKTVEEVAEEYLNELVNRNLVQACEGFHGIEQFCQVHNLIHEIASEKAAELNFYQIWDGKGSSFRGKSRRLLISQPSVENVLESTGGSQVRSVFLSNIGALSNSILVTLFEKYKHLTMLDIENIPLELLPKEVGNLLSLKYLSLKNTLLKRLPKSVGKLHKLQTLDLSRTRLVKLPREIIHLQDLRHLLASRYDDKTSFDSAQGVRIKEGIGCLVNLQTLMTVEAHLSGFDVIHELKRLRRLRRLSVSRLSSELSSSLCACIKKMSHLESLSLYSMNKDESLDIQTILYPPTRLERLVLKGLLQSFPDWISGLENLSVLCLSLSRLSDDPLRRLCNLPNLESLWLYQAYEGKQFHFQEGQFQKLKLLVLRELYGLEAVEVDEAALPLLKELRIGSSPQLNEVPSGVQHLRNLKTLVTCDMPNEYVLSMQPNGGSDYWKVKHVPSVLFWYRVEGKRYISYKNGELNLMDRLQGSATDVHPTLQKEPASSFSYSDVEEGNGVGQLGTSSSQSSNDQLSLSSSRNSNSQLSFSSSFYTDDIEE